MDSISIAVRPTIQGRDPLMAYGSLSSGEAGRKVTVQFEQCGLYPIQFRDHAEALTEAGGSWSLETTVGANGTFRAMADGGTSNEITVLARADVRLSPQPLGRYTVNVVARASYWRKHVVIQRYDRARGTWVKVKRLVLDDQSAARSFVWTTTGKFALELPRGTTIRAVLPRDQAKPCHIAGYSTLQRT